MIEQLQPLQIQTLQPRTEHSRSIGDANKYKALQTLTELGLLVPLSEVETFHGRAASAGDAANWNVDPTFSNAGNTTGNHNIHKVSTLYTGEESLAGDFARARVREMSWDGYRGSLRDKVRDYTVEERASWLGRLNERERARAQGAPAKVYTEQDLNTPREVQREANWLEQLDGDEGRETARSGFERQYRAEVHEITSADIDATVIDYGFDISKLGNDDKAKYYQALRGLALKLTEGSPVSFAARDAVAPFGRVIKEWGKQLVAASDVAEIAARAGIDEQVALQLSSAYNACQVGLFNPAYLAYQMLDHGPNIHTDQLEIDGHKQSVPLNLEYAQRLMREAHIVGVKQGITSDTLGRKAEAVSFFDLSRVTTVKGLEVERQTTLRRLGGMATALGRLLGAEGQSGSQALLRLLEDPHAKPEALIQAAKQVEGYETVFDADAGNWEGYALGEHTETGLRNLDENFADTLPVELLKAMRLVIIAHDLGKPEAAANGRKHLQDEYNVRAANDFLTKLGVDERAKNLLLAIVVEGEDRALKLALSHGDGPAVDAMRALAKETLGQFNGSADVIEDQITAFTEMCNMFLVADGGAYTSMAVTRSRGGRYRNAPSFNSTFAQPVGPGGRDIRVRGRDQAPATKDLTPKASAVER